jgi:hypothetical protein
MDKNIQSAVEKLTKALYEIESIVLEQVDKEKVKARLDGNFETVNSPVSMHLQFFILKDDPEKNDGVCLSVNFQNHEPVIGGLQSRKQNELHVYADLSFAEGGQISNFEIVRLATDAVDYNRKLEVVTESILLYLKSQVPVILSKLSEMSC